MKKLIVILAALVLIGPMVALVGVGALMNPATTAAACTTDGGGGSVEVGDVPDSLTATTRDGTQVTLDKKQLTHAATIIQIGNKTDGVGPDGITVALMAALTESSLRMLANTGTYPESGDYPNDGNGSDHDSLGLFQMRPQSGWGSVKDLMDPEYQARAFFGGPDGPNYPSPRGLLDIPGWEDMSKGEAAQSVEVSAFPDRYANYEPVAEKIIDTLSVKGTPASTSTSVVPAGSPASAGTAAGTKEESGVVFPLPEGVWVQTDDFGPRIDPITGEATTHSGIDLAAPDGTEILAAADGTVTVAQYTDTGGGHIVIEHPLDGGTVATGYVHMWENGIHVSVGDHVKAGQHIANVGSSGHSTGPHLHFEVRKGGTDGEYTDPAAWLNDHDAADLPESDVTPAEPDTCDADNGGEGKTPGGFDGDPDELVDDPTTEGQITARMAYVMAQTQDAFPDTSWSCYSPRSGTKSEHPLGRACDITFGNQIGSRPTPAQLEDGWEVTNWVKDHADTLGVQYLIWQGTIWNIDRDDEGWRDYNGGGMHDPSDITGGHYDHLHITVKEGN